MKKRILMELADNSEKAEQTLTAFYNNRRVLVTGADGFLGINMVARLLFCGAHVSITSRRFRPRCAHEAVQVFHGDLRDSKFVRAAVQDQDIIFDFAGVSGAVSSNKEPFHHLEKECSPHLNLFQSCIETPDSPVVIFCSTRLVYGRPLFLPVNETHPLAPMNIYAVHKITIENYLNVFAHTHGLPYVIIRLSNPYGPGQPATTKSYGIINLFLRLAAQGQTIEIFGDGSQVRDYVYVDDVINAFMSVAMTKRCYGETFNFGGTEAISIKDAVNAISNLVGGVPVKYRHWPPEYKQIETGNYQSDNSKINQYVQLPPQTSLDKGFQKSIDYYRQEMDTIF